jgi:glycosyltransferase involved in cell wall biosynthesis
LVTLARCRNRIPEMEPEFVTCLPGRFEDELRATGVPVHRLCPARFSRPWTVWRLRRRFRSLLAARGRLDVAVTHGGWQHSIFAPELHRAGIPVVYQHHGISDPRHWLNRNFRRFPPKRTIAVSRWIEPNLREVVPGVPSRVIYNPVDLPPAVSADCVTRIRHEMSTPAGIPVIIMASRLEEWKGQALLIDALAKIPAETPWECWILGGPQREGEADFLKTLQQRVAASGLTERIRFPGQRGNVWEFLGAADIHCQPNTGPEPFGVVFVEALGAGLPVVTTAIGGAVEIVTPDCGILTPPGDPDRIAEALRELLNHPTRRAELGRNGPRRAKELSDPAQQMQQLAAVLREASQA